MIYVLSSNSKLSRKFSRK